ncbi:hypothetical protein VH571_15255 [Frondihabitans sp. 4ASC-45]|uniref:hypothetical protein n=1 Tax=Frondihabitans sp. 4ASC-45 TaxID=3111636 RepID=UPI003C218CE4
MFDESKSVSASSAPLGWYSDYVALVAKKPATILQAVFEMTCSLQHNLGAMSPNEDGFHDSVSELFAASAALRGLIDAFEADPRLNIGISGYEEGLKRAQEIQGRLS